MARTLIVNENFNPKIEMERASLWIPLAVPMALKMQLQLAIIFSLTQTLTYQILDHLTWALYE